MDHINIWIDFAEIMLAKLCADVLHYEINCHMIVSSVPWMDDGTDGWTDGQVMLKLGIAQLTSVMMISPVPLLLLHA